MEAQRPFAVKMPNPMTPIPFIGGAKLSSLMKRLVNPFIKHRSMTNRYGGGRTVTRYLQQMSRWPIWRWDNTVKIGWRLILRLPMSGSFIKGVTISFLLAPLVPIPRPILRRYVPLLPLMAHPARRTPKLSQLATIEKGRRVILAKRLNDDLTKDLALLRTAPILFNVDRRDATLPLTEIRQTERGIGDHADYPI